MWGSRARERVTVFPPSFQRKLGGPADPPVGSTYPTPVGQRAYTDTPALTPAPLHFVPPWPRTRAFPAAVVYLPSFVARGRLPPNSSPKSGRRRHRPSVRLFSDMKRTVIQCYAGTWGRRVGELPHKKCNGLMGTHSPGRLLSSGINAGRHRGARLFYFSDQVAGAGWAYGLLHFSTTATPLGLPPGCLGPKRLTVFQLPQQLDSGND